MLKDILALFLKDLFFPAFCMSCGAEGAFLCDECLKSVIKSLAPAQMSKVNPPLDGLANVFDYKEHSLAARLIHSFKYDFIRELEIPLGSIMSSGFSLDYLPGSVLCPVPLHKKRFKWRGYNQSALLAEQVGRNLNLQVAHLLERTRHAVPQMSLNRDKRLSNLKGAFALAQNFHTLVRPIRNRPVVLVDDVATTLSTLSECAATLKAGGIEKVEAIVLARVK